MARYIGPKSKIARKFGEPIYGPDYSIVANNFYGPIIDRVGTASQGMNGSSAPGTLGSTDPNANYSR